MPQRRCFPAAEERPGQAMPAIEPSQSHPDSRPSDLPGDLPKGWPDGWTVEHHAAVGSTNDRATDLAVKGATEGAIVWADCQTEGRGRSGRAWVSPTGNLYCSAVLRPGVDLSTAANLSFVVALALREAIGKLCPGAMPQLKWPNDILIAGAKVAGILLETGTDDADPFVIAGTGVNIASKPDSPAYPAMALNELGQTIEPADLLGAYLAALADKLSLWRVSGFAPVREEWLNQCIGLGQPISARTGQGVEHGIFESLDGNGALILRQDDGRKSTILAADIFFTDAKKKGAP